MKTMTCNQLGGPASCTQELHAETFEEMAEQSKNHGMEMAGKQDAAHLEVMEKMKEGKNDPEAMQKWMTERKAEFDALSND